jgi:oxygen-independent coproporphyrinogen III oxidase
VSGDEARTGTRPGHGLRHTVPVASVYVHAPFCARRCVYCDFAVSVQASPPLEPWLEALTGELEALGREGRAELATPLETLYVGGGTPSLLGPEAMAGLASVVGPGRLHAAAGLEWTAEANPESFTAEVARAWRRAGVNRLSLGTQSFQEHVLRWMGRLHGAHGSGEAVGRARAAGFDDVSVDLIFGLPPALERDLAHDLDLLLALEVPHVSLYGLTAEPATRLGREVGAGRVAMPSEERYADEYLLIHERLAAEGYEAYEVSNFARAGHRSRHNRVYWEGGPYLGLGNGAHGFLPPERRWNLREWDAYASCVARGELPLADRERVTGPAARLEALWLGLRTDRGVAMSMLQTPPARRLASLWQARGLARVSASHHTDSVDVETGRLVLTPEGWLLLDRLAVELDDTLDEGEDRPSVPFAGIDAPFPGRRSS